MDPNQKKNGISELYTLNFEAVNEKLLAVKPGEEVKFAEFFWSDNVKKLKTNARGDVLFQAKVSQADKKNLNGRIYPKEVLQKAIEKASKKCEEGTFLGAIDHSWDRLQDTCVVWDEIWMEDDGACYGKGRIVKGANHADHLANLIDAGVKIGFSTAGYGGAYSPSDEDRAKYGSADGEPAVIIAPNYRMEGIDPVDNPACGDARIQKNAERASESGKGNSFTENPMKTLAELKAQNPELFKQHEDAVAAAVADKTAEVTKLSKVKDAVQCVIDSLIKVDGVNVPFKDVTAQEAATQIANAKAETALKETELTSLKAKNAALEAEVAALKAEKVEGEKKIADANRKADVIAEANKALKGHKYEKQLVPQATALADDPKFDKAALVKFIADKTAEYDAVYAGKPITNPLSQNFDPKKEGNGDKSASEAFKEAFQL